MFLDEYGAWRQRVADYGRIYGVQYQSCAPYPCPADRTTSMIYSTGGETAGKGSQPQEKNGSSGRTRIHLKTSIQGLTEHGRHSKDVEVSGSSR